MTNISSATSGYTPVYHCYTTPSLLLLQSNSSCPLVMSTSNHYLSLLVHLLVPAFAITTFIHSFILSSPFICTPPRRYSSYTCLNTTMQHVILSHPIPRVSRGSLAKHLFKRSLAMSVGDFFCCNPLCTKSTTD